MPEFDVTSELNPVIERAIFLIDDEIHNDLVTNYLKLKFI